MKLHKLSSNETPLGREPAAIAAMRAAADGLELYPDGNATALREAIAPQVRARPRPDRLRRRLGRAAVAPDLRLYGPGDEGLYSQYGFLVYRIAILAAGGTPVVAPERDHRTDVDALLAAVTPRTRIVYLANPNNPTAPTCRSTRSAACMPACRRTCC